MHFINNIQDMAAAAIASGTHRIEIIGQEDAWGAVLVEREEPDPQMLYMPKARESGPAFVCETPVPDFMGKNIQIIGIHDPNSPFLFRLTVSFTDNSGKLVQYPLEVKNQ